MSDKNGAVKFDDKKEPLELLPPSYWIEVDSDHSTLIAKWYFFENASFPGNFGYNAVPILEFGATKYTAHNWTKGMRWGRLVGAFHRHCNKLVNGVWVPRNLDEIDDDSGLKHGDHAECNRVFLHEYYCQWVHCKVEIGKNDCAWNDKEEVKNV